MSESSFLRRAEPRPEYRVALLQNARCSGDGLAHEVDGESRLIPWSDILGAQAAEVGEPEGVCTVVFDLVVGRDAAGLRVLRFDADPGECAMRVARQLGQALGPERASASIKSVANEGIPSRWYPDLESLELDAVRGGNS